MRRSFLISAIFVSFASYLFAQDQTVEQIAASATQDSIA